MPPCGAAMVAVEGATWLQTLAPQASIMDAPAYYRHQAGAEAREMLSVYDDKGEAALYSMAEKTLEEPLFFPCTGNLGSNVLAVTPSGLETTAEDEQYLAERHVPVDGIGQLQFDALGIHGTPTLALLDGSGRV
jgi:hypothetical protein